MDNVNNSSQVVEAEPIWLKVAQLSAGYHHMEQLSRELVELDAIGRDISSMRAMVRRDVAGVVLQAAIALKKAQSETVEDVPTSPTVKSEPKQDEWANRLVRWADQFGRDLVKLPALLRPSSKHDGDGKPGSGKN